MTGVLRWLGVVLLSCAWLFALPLHARPNGSWAWGCSVLGVVLFAVPERRRSRGARAHVETVVLLGSAAAAQALLTPPLMLFSGRVHETPALAPLLGSALSLLGLEVFREGAVLHVQRAGELLAISCTTEKLGLLPLVWIGAAGACFIGGSRWSRPARRMAALVAVVATYAVLRFAVLSILFVHQQDPNNREREGSWSIEAFQDPRFVLVSFLPLALLLASLLGWPTPNERIAGSSGRRRRWLVAVLSTATAACLLAAFQHHDPGRPKPGRIAVDELHSPQWESAALPLSTDWFGRESVYNYATLVALLEHHYDVRVEQERRWSDESLADVDVLIVKTPTVAYEAAEVDALERFVERGGGLFLIGDHTNLLGMADHLNAIAGRFGIEFRLDAANRLDDGGFHTFEPHPLFLHPVTAHMPEVEFMTSCTLSASLACETVILGSNTFSDPLDYSSPSFFGNVLPDGDDSFGLHLLATARKVEKGRVLALSDGTLFSSFGMLQPGRAELLLGAVDYLARDNDGGYRDNLLWLAAGTLLAIGLAGALASRGETLFLASRWVPLPAFAGALLAAVVVAAKTRSDYSSPEPRTPTIDVAFAVDGFAFYLPPAIVASPYPTAKSFDSFFISAQRVGLFPRVWTLERALDAAEAIVLVNPTAIREAREVRRLEAFVRGGGRLLVLDSVQNGSSTANQLIEPFGLRIVEAARAEKNQYADHGWLSEQGFGETGSSEVRLQFGPLHISPLTQELTSPALTLLGGAALFHSDDGRTSAVIKEHGRGRVVVLVDSVAFSRTVMGEATAALEPGDGAWQAHQLAFRFWEEILGLQE